MVSILTALGSKEAEDVSKLFLEFETLSGPLGLRATSPRRYTATGL